MSEETKAEVIPSPHGTEAAPFAEIHPRTPERDDAMAQLVGHLWKIHLARLYLSTGRCIPEEAKKLGCYFGFCDEKGIRIRPKSVEPAADGRPTFIVESEATHVGWTVAP